MLKVNLWIISFIVIVISNECCSNETSLDVICALKHALCNPNLPRPCCDSIDQCKRLSLDNDFQCVSNIILSGLGKSCLLDQDCDEIKHAQCSKDGKCICRVQTVRTNSWTCAPILGGFCLNNETCAADNAVCTNSKCKCKECYSQRPNNQCVRNVLGTQCDNDDACNLVKFAKCSENKTCVCTSNTTAITPIYCAPIFGGFCWENDECLTHNSICFNNKCQCHGKYNQYTPEKGCVSICENDECYEGTILAEHKISNAICTGVNDCVCFQQYPFEKVSQCTSKDKIVCEADHLCVVENSRCINNFCQCKPQFGYKSNQCLPLAPLNGFCLFDVDCRRVDHAICSKDYKCECDENYVALNQTSCRPIYGGICSKNKDCGNINGMCIGSKCGCIPFMVKFSEYLCLPPQIGIPCERSQDCTKISNSICSDNGICECNINFGEYNSTACASLLGDSCFESQLCAPLHSNCKNNVCLCDDGFLDYSKKKCIPHYLNMRCENHDNCQYIANAKCQNDSNTCTCKNGHRMVNETTCAPLLGESCFENQLCAPLHSSCRNDKCKCNDGFTQYSEEQCLPHYLRMHCENDDNCKYIAYSECQTDINICVCKSTHKYLNDTTCAPLLGESCFKNQLCAPLHSSCRNDKCTCNDGFIQYSKEKCLPHYIRMHCEDDDNCKYIANSECRADISICVCKSTHKFLNETTCAPLLGEHCKPNEQCATKDSYCINNVCTCQLGYQNQNGSCVFINSSSDFIPKYAVCSSDNCECMPNYVPLGHKCLATIGEYCNSDAECYSHNTVCLNNMCRCSVKFYASNKTHCDPIHLGVTCQNSQDCLVAIKNSQCSITDRICVCKKKYFPVNESECLPSLDGNCLSNDDCRLNFTICVHNQCKCQDNFSPISETQCRPDDYFYPCNHVIDCGDPWHYTCNADKKCRCKKNHFSMNRSTCSPGLKGYCWNDSQCTTNNSTCVDFHCKCNDKFVGISNNLCIPESYSKRFIFEELPQTYT